MRMPTLPAVVTAAVLLVAATGCGSGSDSGGTSSSGSCAVAASYACIEWSPTSAGNAQTACSYTHGSYSTAQCPAASRIGRCAIDYGSYVMTVSYYPGAGTEVDLQRACVQSSGSGGVTTAWTPG
jgi:hypothetical protein